MPGDTPETIPEEPIVASAVFALAHVPPVAAFVKAIVPPAHTIESPVVEAGVAVTVTIAVATQPPEWL